MSIDILLPEIKKNILLKNYTTFKIGGKAKYFFVAKNKKDLMKAILIAKKIKLPFFILGGGSNLLVSDEGYKGLVIKIKNEKLKIKKQNEKFKIICEAGLPLSNLVSKSLQVGATGLEWVIGIPGTVGGAIYGNAGAFGKSMKDIIKEVEVFDTKTGRIEIFKNKNLPCIARQNLDSRFARIKDCRFTYRNSIFKQKKNLIILSFVLQIKKGSKNTIRQKIKEYLDHKRHTQPLNCPSAGSVFKNPPGFFAGKLIEKCGLKGRKIGNAKISEKHANFIVNLGSARAKDVLKLIKLIKREVKNKFNVKLEEEIQYFGF